ncbi:hypothetical protein [Sphingobium sp. Ant17]|uniref:hypothetical protein n=1 Tax=Sphingobium sp. Ant17 TaxID=1461752 RepID=UPI00137800DB|nr:hypothetical protein [Sphingobium sp. Ant17]
MIFSMWICGAVALASAERARLVLEQALFRWAIPIVADNGKPDGVDDDACRSGPTGLIKDIGGLDPGGVQFSVARSERYSLERSKRHVHVDHEDTASTVMRNAAPSSSTR